MRFLVGCVNQSDMFCGTEYRIYDSINFNDFCRLLKQDGIHKFDIYCVYDISGKHDLKRYI